MGTAFSHFAFVDNKSSGETISEQGLILFERNPKEFLSRFVIADESWVHWYTPENREQSKLWEKVKTVPSAGKVMMVNAFWASQYVVNIDCLEKCKTVAGIYYVELLAVCKLIFQTG